jgi:serine/threonine protein kinase
LAYISGVTKRRLANRYEIEHRLGGGAMGTVFYAVDLRLRRPVAVKVLNVTAADDPRVALFHREARAAANLRHPGIVGVLDYSGPDELPPFLVMELVPGSDLQEVLQAHAPLPALLVFAIARQLAAALAHAHGEGFVHRDLKPANIMLGQDGRVVLTDFGVAKAFRDAGRLGTTLAGENTGLVGTPSFLSPEQILDEECTPDSDLFALGSVLYATLAGEPPFCHPQPAVCLDLIARGVFTPLAERVPGAEPELAALIGECLRPAPFERPSAQDLGQRCQRWLVQHQEPEAHAVVQRYTQGEWPVPASDPQKPAPVTTPPGDTARLGALRTRFVRPPKGS